MKSAVTIDYIGFTIPKDFVIGYGLDYAQRMRNLKQIYRLIGKVPTVAAFTYRHHRGLPYVYPDNDLSYPGNFLNMLDRMTEAKYQPNPVKERDLRKYFHNLKSLDSCLK